MDVTQTVDGDRSVIKKVAANTVHGSQGGDQTTTHTTCLLRSNVLGGQVITELGASERGFVYLGGEVLAVQERATQTVTWEHRDIGNASLRMTSSNGTVSSEGLAELDPLGSNAGLSASVLEISSPAQYWKMSGYPGLGPSTSTTCNMDFIPTPCSEVSRALHAGAAEQCKYNYCGPRIVPVRNSQGTTIGEGLAPLTRDPDSGRLGYSHIYAGGRPDTAPPGNTPPVLRRSGPNRSPGNLRDEADFTFADGPQNPGFNLGSVAFTDSQRKILDSSYNRINQDDCKNFINATLAKHKVDKQFNSLDKLLNRTRLSYYDTGKYRNYSPSELGLDIDATLKVRGDFLDGAAAVTVMTDPRNIFLSDGPGARAHHAG